MARGRTPKPTQLKVVEGNAGKRQLPTNEPSPESVYEPPPEELQTDPVAAAEWERIVPELVRWGLYSTMDRAMLTAYCMAVSMRATAISAIEKTRQRAAAEDRETDGLIVASPKGYPMQSPYLAILNRANETIHKFGSEFGLSPVARVRLAGTAQGDLFNGWGGSSDGQSGDAFDSYMARAG